MRLLSLILSAFITLSATSPAEDPFVIEEMTFTRNEQKIYGELFLPKDPSALVICSHGFGGNMTNLEDYARRFAENGIAAYTFDFIGGGYGSRSDGKMTEMSVLTEAADLNVIVDGFHDRFERIFLLGESQGGFVSTYVAASRPDDIAGLIALYPAYVLQDDAKERNGSTSVMGMQIGQIYNEDALSFDIYDMMPSYEGPVLLMHGTADSIVPISYSEHAAETFPLSEMIMFDGADHGFYGADRRRAAELAVEFVEGQI